MKPSAIYTTETREIALEGAKTRLLAKRAASSCDLARLARQAIQAGQFQALSRHLQKGLDPNALLPAGSRGLLSDRPTLLEWSYQRNQKQCFDILRSAGAEITPHLVELAVVDEPKDDWCLLTEFLDSGMIDINKSPEPGLSWVDYNLQLAGGFSHATLMRAIANHEKRSLGDVAPVANAGRRRVSL